MSSKDSRTHYLRNTAPAFLAQTVPQSFYDARPVIKTAADETTGTPETYYTEADGMTLFSIMKLYRPQSVKIVKEAPDAAPVTLATLDQIDTPEDMPAAATHVVYGLHKWTTAENADVIRRCDALGVDPSEVLILWGDPINRYLQTGKLAAE